MGGVERVRAFEPSANPTPTISKKVNAGRLENYRAKELVKKTDLGVAKAGALVFCGPTESPGASSSIVRSFNNIAGSTITLAGRDSGDCTIDFGVPVDDLYIVATTSEGELPAVVISRQSGTSIDLRVGAGGLAGGHVYVLVY